MLKKEAPIMQASQESGEVEVPAQRREELALKGKRLYSKYCGTDGHGICAESFVEYHIWRGEYSVARDFLGYLLHIRETGLDPEKSAMTEKLIGRVQVLLGEETFTENSAMPVPQIP